MKKRIFYYSVICLFVLSVPVLSGKEIFSEKTFMSPSSEYGPMTWWHWINGHVTKDGIRKDLEAMHKVGIRGVQVFNTHMYMKPGPVKFGSEEWNDLTDYAISLCDSLGMKFCITSGAGWSGSGGPWVGKDQAMKKLVFSETRVSGGTVNVRLPLPEITDGYYRDIAVQAVPERYAGGMIEDLPVKMMTASKAVFTVNGSDTKDADVLQTADIMDLTASMDEAGCLQCVLPEGEWTILRYGYTLTGKKAHPAAWGGEGYEVNKLDSADVLVQYDHFLKVLFDRNSRYLGKTIEGVLFDSYEAGFQNWTRNLPEEFRKFHGYDLLSYMPVFTGRIVESPRVTEQVLYDFRLLLDHMLSEYYYGTMQRKINERGVKVYAEAQGGPVPSKALNFVDIPMNEFWNPDTTPRMGCIRLTASQADLRGKPVVAAEAFTSKPENGKWQNYPGKMKKPGDLAYIGGINRFCFHTYAHQPVDYAPGFSLGRYGTMFGRLSTWWDYSSSWIEYLSRCQYMLQQGIKYADVAFLFHYDIRYAYNSRITSLPAGYDYRIAYPEDLSNAKVKGGKIIFPNGGTSSVLILAPNSYLDMATLDNIRELVLQGAVVCGEPPVFQGSLSESAEYSPETFDSIVHELWGNTAKKGVNCLGKGKVLRGYSNSEVISYLELDKDAEFGPDIKGVHYLHKTVEGNDLYFISNQNGNKVDTEAVLKTDKQYCSSWNPVTGEVYAEKIIGNGEYPAVSLHLPEYGSMFLLFTDKPVTKNSLEQKLPVREIRCRQKWTMSFADKSQCDKEIRLDDFIPLNESLVPEIKYYSGTVIYSNSFKVNTKRLTENKGEIHLSFDSINDICEVFVNGESAGVLWTKPYVIDITRFVRPGDNTVEIRVADSWINRVIGDEQFEPDIKYEMDGSKFTVGRISSFPEWLYSEMPADRQRKTFYIWKHYDKDSPLVPSGISGKVRIEVCR